MSIQVYLLGQFRVTVNDHEVSVGDWHGEFCGAIACPDGGIDLASVAPRERWEAAGLRSKPG